jgi:lipopolysaccharide transport system permease protein
MFAYFSALIARRFILMTLVRRELRIRYKDSFLGWLWIFGAPLLMMATYTIFVLGVIRPDSAGGTARWHELSGLWLCLGLWQWLAESANRSVTAFHDNSQLVKRTPIPLSLLPATNIIVSAISFLIPFLVSVLVLLWSGQGLLELGFVVVAVASFLPWLVAFSYFVSVIGTYLKDAKHAMPLLMNVGLFLSPVLYSANSTPKLLSTIMVFNPFSSSLGAVRFTALGGDLFVSSSFWVMAACGVLAMFACFKFFILRKKDFYDVV